MILLIFIDIVIIMCFRILWRVRIGRGFSPTALYGIIWGFVWFFHLVDLMGYYEISNQGLIYSIIPLVSLGFAESFLLFYNNKRKKFYLPDKINAVLFRRWVIILGSITLFSGVTIFIASIMVFGKDWILVGMAPQIKVLRYDEGMAIYFGQFKGTIFFWVGMFIPILQGASYGAIMLGIFYLKLINSRYWIGIILPIIGSVLYDIGNISRSYTYHMILFLILMQFALPFKENISNKYRVVKKSQVLLTALMFLFGIFSTYFITNINKQYEQSGPLLHLSISSTVERYIDYHAGNLVTFDQTLDQNPITYGRMSFYSIEHFMRILFRIFRIIPSANPDLEQIKDWELTYPEIYKNRMGGLNTYSWLRYLYSDFSILGLFLIPFILGIVLIYFTIKYRTKRSFNLHFLAIVAICYIVIIRSPTIMVFRDLAYFFGLFLLYIASLHISIKSRKSSDNSTFLHNKIVRRTT